MTQDEIKKLYRTVDIIVSAYGLDEISLDIAHEVYLKITERDIKNYYIKFVTIDVLREKVMNRRSKRSNIHLPYSSAHGIDINDRKLQYMADEFKSDLDFQKRLQPLNQSTRAMLNLYFKWGLTVNEVADCFGLSGAGARKRILTALDHMKKKCNKED